MTENSASAQRKIIEQAGIASDLELVVARCLLQYECDRQPPDNQYTWDGLEEWQRATWIIEARDVLETAGV